MAKAKSEWRRQWRAMKEKHKAHLSKIKFKSDLGPNLDKLHEIDSKPLSSPSTIEADKLYKATAAQARACVPILDDYLEKVKAVTDNNAKNELTNLLNQIKQDCQRLDRELSK